MSSTAWRWKKDADVDLLRVINEGARGDSESGRYDEIYETWFGKVKAR